jgi:hypothetical protein
MRHDDPELEPLDGQLRDAFRRAHLPAAPSQLRAEIELLPASLRGGSVLVGQTRFGRWPRASAMLALVAVVAVVAFVGVGLPILRMQSQSGPGAVASARAVDSRSRFELDLSVPKTDWTTSESIIGQASLSYLGSGSVGVAGAEFLLFEFDEVGGTRKVVPASEQFCQSRQLDAGHPITSPITKSGGWLPGDPNASFLASFFANPGVRLPAGTWTITAIADFSEQGCGGPVETLRASVTVDVTESAELTSSPEESATIQSSPSPSPLSQSSASPTVVATSAASYFSSGSPRPGDEAMAVSIATRYQTFLKQGDWAQAWAMLSPEDKAGEPYDVFVYNWAAIKESWHTLDFTLGTPTHDWQSWNPATSVAGDFGRAFIIQVDYPFTGQTNYWDVLLIMPTIDGLSWTVS